LITERDLTITFLAFLARACVTALAKNVHKLKKFNNGLTLLTLRFGHMFYNCGY
jgi:hypothetical protein